MRNLKSRIIYIKNGYKKEVTINFGNKKRVMQQIFLHPFSHNKIRDEYKILEDIEFIEFQNITFYQDVHFFCSNTTQLILNHCTFKAGRFCVEGGIVEINSPNFANFYMPSIAIADAKKIELDLNNSKNCTLFLEAEIISVNGRNTQIDTLKRTEYYTTRTPKYILLQNIKKVSDLEIDAETIEIKDSNILITSIRTAKIMAEKLKLVNTDNIYSKGTLNLDCRKIETDQDVTLESDMDIIIFNDIYKNKNYMEEKLQIHTNDLITNQSFIDSSTQIGLPDQRRQLISILKGMREQAIQEIHKKELAKEKEGLEEIEKEQKILEEEYQVRRNALMDKKAKVLTKAKEYEKELKNIPIKKVIK